MPPPRVLRTNEYLTVSTFGLIGSVNELAVVSARLIGRASPETRIDLKDKAVSTTDVRLVALFNFRCLKSILIEDELIMMQSGSVKHDELRLNSAQKKVSEIVDFILLACKYTSTTVPTSSP
ncbi:MAG: hypothetical protein ACKODM_06560 [Cytophagales bacterium]